MNATWHSIGDFWFWGCVTFAVVKKFSCGSSAEELHEARSWEPSTSGGLKNRTAIRLETFCDNFFLRWHWVKWRSDQSRSTRRGADRPSSSSSRWWKAISRILAISYYFMIGSCQHDAERLFFQRLLSMPTPLLFLNTSNSLNCSDFPPTSHRPEGFPWRTADVLRGAGSGGWPSCQAGGVMSHGDLWL